jgi:hypothetical protein
MKKFMKAAKILAIGLFALTVAGCSTLDHKSTEDWQGKVWRVIVVKQFIDSTTHKVGRDFAESTKFDAARDTGLRIARVHVASGWDTAVVNVVVPDNIEFSQIERGAIVDVMTETGPNTDFSKQRYTRILSLVCVKTDEACLEREKSAKRAGSVLDATPSSDISAKYGVTYNRRVTAEELKTYN